MSDCTAIAELDRAIADVLRGAGISEEVAPVDLHRVAMLLGVEVREGAGGAEGCLRLRQGRAVVEVSPWGSEKRKRFTTAHELGHVYLLHPDRGLSGTVCRRWSDIEQFCNDFAAALLLPRVWLAKQVRAVPADLTTLAQIACMARVSRAATSQRLVRSGMWLYSILEWQRKDRAWTIRGGAGMHADLRGRMRLAEVTEQLLDRLAASQASSRVQLRVQVVLDDHDERALDVEIELRGDRAQMLVPVRFDGRGWEPRWRPYRPVPERQGGSQAQRRAHAA